MLKSERDKLKMMQRKKLRQKYFDNRQLFYQKVMKSSQKVPSTIYKRLPGNQAGNWLTFEHVRYLRYIKRFRSQFENAKGRRKCKIFKKMSQCIKTRTSDQCRSHHQKFQNRFGTLDGIIQHLEKEISLNQCQGNHALIPQIQVKQQFQNDKGKIQMKTGEDLFSNNPFQPTLIGLSFVIPQQLMVNW